MKKVLTAPITFEQIKDLKIGDTVFYTGLLATCRDAGHNRVINENIMPETFDFSSGALYHAGPIAKQQENGEYKIIAIGPTTSRRMESVEEEFIKKTGVKLIIGKGGMLEKTANACKKYGAIHCAFPGGCGVVAAKEVERVENVEWLDLGMPEALWILKVKEFGPLIVSVDTKGDNLFENNKKIFKQKLSELL